MVDTNYISLVALVTTKYQVECIMVTTCKIHQHTGENFDNGKKSQNKVVWLLEIDK